MSATGPDRLKPSSDDQFEIRQALLSYTCGIDTKDYDLFRSGFTADVRVTFEKWVDPLEDLEQLTTFMEVLHRNLDGSAHRVTNFFYLEMEADRAVVRTYIHALLVKAGHPGGDSFDVYGTYTDELRRGENGWRVAAKHCDQLFDSGNADVLEFEAASLAVAELTKN
jgi:hypothetical protein